MNRRGFLKKLGMATAGAVLAVHLEFPALVPIAPRLPTYEEFCIPLIRSVFPRLVAQDLISVQPMANHAGKIFYLAAQYSAPAPWSRAWLRAHFENIFRQ
jgi:Major capsid protein Gp23